MVDTTITGTLEATGEVMGVCFLDTGKGEP